ncbi:MAG TPA: pyridoxal phosphate-dependent aminotransferase [Candidatus Ruania gallistercoris]|uniref:alanine transaminase n=1 Tax=Candidatus Ruania gallistercoris TaxID=2838746 RepID=A0A9D2J563_9MICO|nr:pyridoxal phosphate-dependent aminotransferase [Candidatus Ruania gallistercoris]
MRTIKQSKKLKNVRYDVRGPILVEAQRLEALGHRILKLNIGNPAPFGFEAPQAIQADVIHHLPEAQGYSDSRGIFSARTAVAQYYQSHGLQDAHVEDVFIGNGVSELISMVLQTFVDDGNEILVPAPDYPLWTGAVSLSGGTPVHYLCDESNGWMPDLADIEAKITENTHALVIINPNNPTGAVYSEETVKALVDIARRHDLVLFSDEIYEKILFNGAEHHHTATYAGDDVLCLTFSGLSKAYRVCGYRAGWLMISGPKERAADFIEGLTLMANMRMCSNVPAQHAIQTALGGYQSIEEFVGPGGRFYEQAMLADRLLNEIPGVTSVRPSGALYCFPRLDPEIYPIADDQQFVIDLLRAKHILVTHGTGFNWPSPDHFRLVTLPDVEMLEEAIGRIAEFLEEYRYARGTSTT